MKSKQHFDIEQLYNFYYQTGDKSFYYQNSDGQKYYYQALVIQDQSVLKHFSDYSQNHLWKQMQTVLAPLAVLKIFIKQQPIWTKARFSQSFSDLNYQINHQGLFDQKQKQLLAKKWQLYCNRDFETQFYQPMLTIVAYHNDRYCLETVFKQMEQLLKQYQISTKLLVGAALIETIKSYFHFDHQDHFGAEVFEKSIKPSFKDFVNLDLNANQDCYYNQRQRQFNFFNLKNQLVNEQFLNQLAKDELIYYHYQQIDKKWFKAHPVLISSHRHTYHLIKKWQPVYQQLCFGKNNQLVESNLPIMLEPLINNPLYLQTKPLIIGKTNHGEQLVAIDLTKSYLIVSQSNMRVFDQVLTYFYLQQQSMLIQIQSALIDPWINYFHLKSTSIEQYWFDLFGQLISINDPLFYPKVVNKSQQLWKLLTTYQPQVDERLKIYFDQAVQHLYRLQNQVNLNWQELYVTLTNNKLIKIEANDQSQFQILLNAINQIQLDRYLQPIWTKPQSVIKYENQAKKYFKYWEKYQSLKNDHDQLIKQLEKWINLEKQQLDQKWIGHYFNHCLQISELLNAIDHKKYDLTWWSAILKINVVQTSDDEQILTTKAGKIKTNEQLLKLLKAHLESKANDLQAYKQLMQTMIKTSAKILKHWKQDLDKVATTLPINLATVVANQEQPLILDWRPMIAKGWQTTSIKTLTIAISALVGQNTVLLFDQLQNQADYQQQQIYLLTDYDLIQPPPPNLNLIINAHPNYQWEKYAINNQHLASIDDRYYYCWNNDRQEQQMVKLSADHPIDVVRQAPDLSHPYDYFQNQISHYETRLYQSEHLDYQQDLIRFQNRIQPNRLVNRQAIAANNRFANRLWKKLNS